MTKYDKSIIYKICCKDLSIQDIYIGSTLNFRNRKWKHKNSCYDINNRHYNIYLYKFIRDNGGWDNWEMILIKEVSCNSKLELYGEERKTYEELKPTLNTQKPLRTKKEYKKECMPTYDKEYNERNKEKIQQQKKENYEKNKECILQKQQKYRSNTEVKKHRNEKIKCDCGGVISRCGISKHKKTEVHKNNMLLI
tara:strand:+ start:88 stop:672 length:585 start_codon:yes stop_codon:yes gene_type:complete